MLQTKKSRRSLAQHHRTKSPRIGRAASSLSRPFSYSPFSPRSLQNTLPPSLSKTNTKTQTALTFCSFHSAYRRTRAGTPRRRRSGRGEGFELGSCQYHGGVSQSKEEMKIKEAERECRARRGDKSN
jgi:hypothetical protein